MGSKSILLSLFRYKAWANEELFNELQSACVQEHQTVMHTAIRILNHVYVVDSIFAAHLHGEKHSYTQTNTEETPSFGDLFSAVRESDLEYIDYIEKLSPEDLRERIDFRFTDGNAGRMSREEMLVHVATHGGYHRGAVGRAVPQLSKAPPRDSFSSYLHAAESGRRVLHEDDDSGG
jgi:uncharacterized damage-inducible protein DinB